jgi:hypothetical protein
MCRKTHKKYGGWCFFCRSKYRTYTIDDLIEFAEGKNGYCLSKEYTTSDKYYTWKCHQGHEWDAKWTNINNQRNWCSSCTVFRSESICKKIIEEYFDNRFNFIKSKPKFLGGLELDGYCEEIKIAFEYNGEQHYKYMKFFHKGDIKNFEVQQERDIRKIKLCEENSILLIIIPYQYSYENEKELEEYISNLLDDIPKRRYMKPIKYVKLKYKFTLKKKTIINIPIIEVLK